jgi:hypothetical protein
VDILIDEAGFVASAVATTGSLDVLSCAKHTDGSCTKKHTRRTCSKNDDLETDVFIMGNEHAK